MLRPWARGHQHFVELLYPLTLTMGFRGSLPSVRRASFVPHDFDPPAGLVTPDFVLEPLGPQHNERDYAAWTSSMEHILATPGAPDPTPSRRIEAERRTR